VLRQAADSYDRAARHPYGRIPRATPAGNSLRRTARLLSTTAFAGDPDFAQVALILRLAALIEDIADLRATQRYAAQAAAARQAAEHLHATRTAYAARVPGTRATCRPGASRLPDATGPVRARDRPATWHPQARTARTPSVTRPAPTQTTRPHPLARSSRRQLAPDTDDSFVFSADR